MGDDPTYSVYYGDPPCSIRELCKRYVNTRFWYARLGLNNTVRVNRLTNKNAPYHTGWDPNGVDASTRALEPEGPPASLTVGHTAYHSWFTPAYAGVRGAYRKKYFFSAPTTRQTPVIARDTFKNSGNGSISWNSLGSTFWKCECGHQSWHKQHFGGGITILY